MLAPMYMRAWKLLFLKIRVTATDANSEKEKKSRIYEPPMTFFDRTRCINEKKTSGNLYAQMKAQVRGQLSSLLDMSP